MKKNIQNIQIEKLPEFKNHEFVSFFSDEKVGLRGFICIHNTNLGPATGGTRYFHYASEEDALRDALRLSEAMTYKCALAGVPYGGGKAVLINDKKNLKSRSYLEKYAEKINILRGNFYTGEDVGISESDAGILAKHSKFIVGAKGKGRSGGPSPWAALGIFYALRAALKEVVGSEEIRNRIFAIKGLGKVGLELLRLIYEQGGQIIAADINQKAVQAARKKFPKIKIVKPAEIHKIKADVYSPCALGNEFNDKTIKELKCKIICGGANNQLFSEEAGARLYKRNILYIPDYIANSGGLINVKDEFRKDGYNRERVLNKIKNIKNTVARVIEFSKKRKKPTNYIADELAEKIFMKKNVFAK